MEKVHGVLVMTLLEILYFFGVDNNSSSHTDNWKNNFLALGEGPTQGINDSTISVEKIWILAKQVQNFAYVYMTVVMRVTCM